MTEDQAQYTTEPKGIKRMYEETSAEDSNKRVRGPTGPHTELRCLIPSMNAGTIIGRGGVNIKRLRDSHAATITVPDSGTPERVLSVSAPLGTCCEIVDDICKMYLENADSLPGEMRFLVPQNMVGPIIGKAGANINAIREKTNAEIKVFPMQCPASSERVIQVSGEPNVISDTLELIQEMMANADQRPNQRTFHEPYDPNNCDEDLACDYGGFTYEHSGRGRWRRGGRSLGFSRGMGRGDRGFGRGDRGFSRAFRGVRTSSGAPRGFSRGGGGGRGGIFGFGDGFGPESAFVEDEDPFMVGGGYRGRGAMPRGVGYSRGGGGGFGERGGFAGGYCDAGDGGFGADGGFGEEEFGVDPQAMGYITGDDGQCSTQVTIPQRAAGAVIGRGGERIRNVRLRTGAQIKIGEQAEGSDDRIITVSGTPEQIQYAQYLMQQNVRMYGTGA